MNKVYELSFLETSYPICSLNLLVRVHRHRNLTGAFASSVRPLQRLTGEPCTFIYIDLDSCANILPSIALYDQPVPRLDICACFNVDKLLPPQLEFTRH